MSSLSTRPRLIIGHGSKKNAVQNLEPPPPNLGTLSPDPQSDVLPPFPSAGDSKESNFLTVGKYILIKQNEKSESYLAINTTTQEELTCKVFPRRKYWESVTPYWHVDSHPHVAPYREIILGDTKAYIFFPKGHGDLHSYVREKKRLREDEAKTLFRQIVSTVIHCHDNGVILRDLKLRKFIFADEDRTQLQLEGLEDAVVLEEEVSDTLKDKHGCPAYVSPEILSATESGYSGKSADVWSLGVMLYTMLVGRYPFHDAQPLALFGKIRRGQFHVPDALTPKARCLIRCLLRRDPDERMPSNEILNHPWFKSAPTFQRPASANQHSKLQVVPEWASASSPGPFDYL